MKPRHLMTFGAAIGVLAIIAAVLLPDGMWVVLAFGAGSLFGKGYGAAEERGTI